MVSPNVSKGIGEQKITKGRWYDGDKPPGMWYQHIKASELPVRILSTGT